MPIVGFLIMLAILAIVVWVVVSVARAASGRRKTDHSSPMPRQDRALELLRERYARGEIDRETYERMRTELSR
ncbi:MAG: SHOCT domain-containing protein [Salinisphaera sp.]|nr:SHOCT domain-containing protein [Salinisphaera sp.]